jgi:hypothetical protein
VTSRESHPAGTAVLDRGTVTDGPSSDDGLPLLLVDDLAVPPVRLAQTHAPFVLGSVVRFRIEQSGVTCVITLDDGGDPLYLIPPTQRKRVRPGSVVDVTLTL